MEADKNSRNNDLRDLILNATEPFVIKNKLNWELVSWRLENWESLLKQEKLPFRCGKKGFTMKPQWERSTATRHLTFTDFLSFTQKPSEDWMYFDYKYLREWFSNIEDIKKNISWDTFGFPELSSEDSTIWIGSSGAHTPCHSDTYGCNLVAQIYGKKQWVLFSPDENLKSTRVPYEESSIYSNLNFYSPNVDEFKEIRNCRKVILEPGDVLFVPHKWWHYVENLETAISINVWLPMAIDSEERLEESLVQFFIGQITKNLVPEIKDCILNPNSDKELENLSLNNSVELISTCKTIVTEKKQEALLETEIFFKKYSFLHKIPILSETDFLKFLQEQRNRFEYVDDNIQENNHEDLINVINAFTHSDVVSLIKNKLLQ